MVVELLTALGGKRQEWLGGGPRAEAVSRLNGDLTVSLQDFTRAVRAVCAHLHGCTGPAFLIGLLEASSSKEATSAAFDLLYDAKRDKLGESDCLHRWDLKALNPNPNPNPNPNWDLKALNPNPNWDLKALTEKDIRKSGREYGITKPRQGSGEGNAETQGAALLAWHDLSRPLPRGAWGGGGGPLPTPALSQSRFAAAVQPHTWLLRFKNGPALASAAVGILLGSGLGERDVAADLRDAIERGYKALTHGLLGQGLDDSGPAADLGLEELLAASKHIGLPFPVSEASKLLLYRPPALGRGSMQTRRRCVSKRRFGEILRGIEPSRISRRRGQALIVACLEALREASGGGGEASTAFMDCRQGRDIAVAAWQAMGGEAGSDGQLPPHTVHRKALRLGYAVPAEEIVQAMGRHAPLPDGVLTFSEFEVALWPHIASLDSTEGPALFLKALGGLCSGGGVSRVSREAFGVFCEDVSSFNKVSKSDLARVAALVRKDPLPPMALDRAIDMWDQDNDGFLSLEEFAVTPCLPWLSIPYPSHLIPRLRLHCLLPYFYSLTSIALLL